MSRKKTEASRLAFWINHASCFTIMRMAAEVGLYEKIHGCLPFILGEVPRGIREAERHLARLRADVRLDRSVTNQLRIEKATATPREVRP